MEHFRVRPVDESDFDSVIANAGGIRINAEGSADYLLNEAIIELKLVKEEGFEKETRQRKIAGLFKKYQPQAPVVVVDPKSLNETDSREYYNAVSGPIKSHVKKAADQLEKTSKRFTSATARVLVILNVGYSALSIDEFKSVCVKCAHNDTTKVDWLICGGVYFYSDKVDNYLIEPFEPIAINLNSSFPSLAKLIEAWGTFAEQIATEMIRNQEELSKDGKMPVLDLVFEIDGTQYVKPSPRAKSNFWPGGYAPRENSAEKEKYPPIAIVFPALTSEEWRRFRTDIPSSSTLQDSYAAWINFQDSEDKQLSQTQQPFVAVPITHSAFKEWISKPRAEWKFTDLAAFSKHLFNLQMEAILKRIQKKKETRVIPLEYLHLVVNEIGQDKANDLCSLYHVSELPGFERNEIVFEKERMFFEHGGILAATYAIKRRVANLIYTKQKT